MAIWGVKPFESDAAMELLRDVIDYANKNKGIVLEDLIEDLISDDRLPASLEEMPIVDVEYDICAIALGEIVCQAIGTRQVRYGSEEEDVFNFPGTVAFTADDIDFLLARVAAVCESDHPVHSLYAYWAQSEQMDAWQEEVNRLADELAGLRE
jgi:hypothetical protein